MGRLGFAAVAFRFSPPLAISVFSARSRAFSLDVHPPFVVRRAIVAVADAVPAAFSL